MPVIQIQIGGAVYDAAAETAKRSTVRRNIRGNIERNINWMLRMADPANEKAGFFREQCPGLVEVADLGAEIRSQLWTGDRWFVVAGNTLYEVDSTFSATSLGALNTSSGPVDMAIGRVHLCIVDGLNGYVYNLETTNFTKITSPNFYGSRRVGFLNGFFLFSRPDTQQFYFSAFDDATSFDALDFASAESAPDDIVAILVDHREMWLAGQITTEIWFQTPDGEFARSSGVAMEVGCIATHSMIKIDHSVYWIGQDANGSGIVYRADGYKPVRISGHKEEEALSKSTDLTSARAWSYQQDGQTFYCVSAPGLSTTLVYDASVGKWHERAEFVNGGLRPWRATSHASAFLGNYVGDADGKLYRIDPGAYLYGDSAIYREFTSLHSIMPSMKQVGYTNLRLDVSVGEADVGVTPYIELQYSNDGGITWGNWMKRPLGEIGKFDTSVRWARLGQARDRVWRFRCSDQCRASIIGYSVVAREGGQ